MRKPEVSRAAVLIALATSLAASGCLVDSQCVGNSDCTGNEQCIGGDCVLECADGDLSRCPATRPVCLIEENRCVECTGDDQTWCVDATPFCLVEQNRCAECLLPTDCGEMEQCVSGSCRGLAPEFELIDMNSHSATYEQTVALSDFDGGVVMLFFATMG